MTIFDIAETVVLGELLTESLGLRQNTWNQSDQNVY